MKRLTASVAALVVAILSFALNARATTITYEISGVASGQIGTTTFTNASIELIGVGDTANDTSLFGGLIFGNPFNTFTVTIGGVGTATITDLAELWAIPTPSGLSTVPVVVIGRVDAPPALDSITGIGFVGSSALTGYEGATGIGPITDGGDVGFPGCGGPSQDPCIHTTLGLLSFSSNLTFPPTTEATFAATVVPEPTTLLLLGTGVLGLIGMTWRRRSPATFFVDGAPFIFSRMDWHKTCPMKERVAAFALVQGAGRPSAGGHMGMKMNMSRLRYLVAAATLLLTTPSLGATTITPGQNGVSPTNFGMITSGTPILNIVTGTFILDGGAVVGAYGEGVLVDPFGVTCTGCLDFFFQVGNHSGSTLNITSIGLDGLFPSFSDNVGYATESGGVEIAPASASFGTALPAAPITEFLTLSPGQDSDILVIATNATAYGVNGNLGIGYEPTGSGSVIPGMLTPVLTPEPVTSSLLGIGLLGLIGCTYRRKRLEYLRSYRC